MNKKPIGIILWQGKSMLDGERIMAVATGVYGKSENRKTGDMVQIWILRRDVHPMTARRMGDDFSVCGDCMHRENSTCYVNLCHGPIGVFHAFIDGSYKPYDDSDIELFKGRNIRIGSYGDPAAVPFAVWENIVKVANDFTGYTHQWESCDQRLKTICMASVDSIIGYTKEFDKAQSMGWRTFRVRESADNPLADNEFVCPASKEAGQKTTCENCGLCSGLSAKITKSISIILHADADALGNWRYNRFMRVMKLRKWKKAWRRDYKSERKQYRAICKF
jgi:hypothetical protein